MDRINFTGSRLDKLNCAYCKEPVGDLIKLVGEEKLTYHPECVNESDRQPSAASLENIVQGELIQQPAELSDSFCDALPTNPYEQLTGIAEHLNEQFDKVEKRLDALNSTLENTINAWKKFNKNMRIYLFTGAMAFGFSYGFAQGYTSAKGVQMSPTFATFIIGILGGIAPNYGLKSEKMSLKKALLGAVAVNGAIFAGYVAGQAYSNIIENS